MLRRLLFLYVFSLLFSSNVSAHEKLTIMVGEYPPYVSEHLKYNGVSARIIIEAFALENVLVEYKFTNWARAFHLVNEGIADGIGPILKNEEREKFYYFSEPVLFETQVFFHLKDYQFNWGSMQDLIDLQIGVTISYSYGKEFDQASKLGKLDIQRVPSDRQNIKKLFSDRIQIFPQSLDVGYYMLQTEFPDKINQITHHEKFVNQSHNYFALSRKNPHGQYYMMLFNRGLQKLKDSGKYEQYFIESRRGDYLVK